MDELTICSGYSVSIAHPRIAFVGERARCPLCKVLEKLADAVAEAQEARASYILLRDRMEKKPCN